MSERFSFSPFLSIGVEHFSHMNCMCLIEAYTYSGKLKWPAFDFTTLSLSVSRQRRSRSVRKAHRITKMMKQTLFNSFDVYDSTLVSLI